MSLEEKDQSLIEQFAALASWEDRYSRIIQIGKTSPGLPEADKIEDLKVSGCQSQVWIRASQENGRLHFAVDSDAMIVKGLVSMLAELFSGETPASILQYQPRFIAELGLQNHLSPSRANGLMNMLKQIKFYALAYQAKG